MKNKILSTVAAMAVLGSSALVADIVTGVTNDVHIGASAIEAYKLTGQAISLGYSGKKVWENGIMFGISMDFLAGKIDVPSESTDTKDTVYGISADLQVGYVPVKDLTVYAIGSALEQSVQNLEGYGFGYGGGIEYAISKSFAVAAEYKTYNMTNKVGDYDYSASGINLKYTWR